MTDDTLSTIALGTSGVAVSRIGWGMWRFHSIDVTAARRRVEAALEAGATLLDTADIYGLSEGGWGVSESLLGQVIAESPGLRDRFQLATKGGIVVGAPYDSSRGYLTSAVEDSLRRLNVERIDLYQIHRPDILAHPAEVAATLSALRDAGKIGEVGVSNHSAAQVAALRAHLPFPIAAIQIEFSPLAIDPIADATLDQAMARGMAVLAWSPLGGGRLGDTASSDPRDIAVRAALDQAAARMGVSRAVAAYAWILAHPAGVIPIVGSQQPTRIAEAFDALATPMTRSDWYAVLTAARGVPLP